MKAGRLGIRHCRRRAANGIRSHGSKVRFSRIDGQATQPSLGGGHGFETRTTANVNTPVKTGALRIGTSGRVSCCGDAMGRMCKCRGWWLWWNRELEGGDLKVRFKGEMKASVRGVVLKVKTTSRRRHTTRLPIKRALVSMIRPAS